MINIWFLLVFICIYTHTANRSAPYSIVCGEETGGVWEGFLHTNKKRSDISWMSYSSTQLWHYLKWQPTPVYSPGESHEQRSLAGYIHGIARVGHDLATKPLNHHHHHWGIAPDSRGRGVSPTILPLPTSVSYANHKPSYYLCLWKFHPSNHVVGSTGNQPPSIDGIPKLFY